MDHLAATDDEFDALLDASSLGAPHVVAETGDIPATERRRMTQAVRQQRRTLSLPGDTSHPGTDGDTENQLEALANAERPSQEVQPVRLGILYSATGSGKSASSTMFLAFYGRNTHGDLQLRRRQLPSLREWAEPSTAGSLMIDLFAHQDVLTEWAASMLRSLREAQTAPASTAARPQSMRLLPPDIATPTPPVLVTLAWAGEERHRPSLWDLQHWIEPRLQQYQSPFSLTPTGLLMHHRPVTHLLISRYTTCAYTAAGSGLLVPKADGARRHRNGLQETGTTGRDLRQTRGTHRMKLRRALIDGSHELFAELRMLIHLDEREPPAPTSSLRTGLTYRVSDPYAVEARFRADDKDETVWVFARDLLRSGLERRSGLGDVVVWPGHGPEGDKRVFMRISSPEGSALLSAADSDLRVFLGAASSLVAYGAEHPHLVPALNALETAIGELARPGRCE
ncbi:SsgA family sporulation/cell division regulator [Streptomyces albogriseolus]|uniref:SsgA family sporulation/cell division regulator n=1 Tax=Streptomyces albogriseolus TaxID=1887 RepID=UPI003791F7D4